MAKRLTDTEKWNDDWYLSLNNDYRIIWQWLLDNCNHAGICKRSIKLVNFMCNTSISEKELIEVMDGRLIAIDNDWFIPKFLKFQYSTLQSQKPVIKSVVKELRKNDFFKYIPDSFGSDYKIEESLDNHSVIITESFRNHSVIIPESFPNDSVMIKDKDKDKDKYSLNNNTVTSNNEVTNYNSEKKEKNNFPNFSDFDSLPEININAIIQRIKITKFIDVSREDLLALWEVFKVENLTGNNYYPNAEKVYKHFGEWVKFQKFEKRKTKETNPYKMNGTERAEWWKEQQKIRTTDNEMPPD